jgi:hypothetical protein
VALHSGYCLRRQYAAFAGVECGQNVRDFFDRLVALHLARQITFRRDRGHIYHLFARSLSAALERQDNRNRRQASPAVIARKLMLLDFVLTQPDREWYVSEAEKVHLLTDTLRVPARALKSPIFVTRDPLRVHLVCLVTDPAARDIALFVRGHHALLTHLPAHTLVIVRPGHISTEEQCRAAHAFAMKAVLAPARTFDRATLRWYLDARRRIDQGQLRTLSVPDINRYRVCGRQAAGALDGLYSRWAELGYPSIESLDFRIDAPADANGVLIVTLPHRYEQFGSLPGIA